jgi:heterodisulfide reductase subunit C
MTEVVNPALADELRALGEFDAEACMNCGVCSAACPLEIDLLPRRLFRHAVLGLDERVRAETEPVFSCLLCGACEQSCPAGVHITENVRVLRRWLLEEASR